MEPLLTSTAQNWYTQKLLTEIQLKLTFHSFNSNINCLWFRIILSSQCSTVDNTKITFPQHVQRNQIVK